MLGRRRRIRAAEGETVAERPVVGDETTRSGRPLAGAPRRRRRGFAAAGDAGAAAVGAAGAGILAIARLIMAIAVLIAVLIGAAIILRDVDATPSNSIVKAVHDGANFFAGAFTGLIRDKGHYKREITIDWGIALLVYLIVGAVISSLIGRVGRGGLGVHRRRAASF